MTLLPEALHKDLEREVKTILPLPDGVVEHWYKRYKEEGHSSFHPYVEIAQLLTNAAQHEKASDFYKRFLSSYSDKNVHSLYLQNLILSQSATNKSLLVAHREWAKAHGNVKSSFKYRHNPVLKSNKKIRIGYICHFFNNSISQNVFLPFLKLHDRKKFEVFCFDDGEPPEGYHEFVDQWIDIKNMNDDELAEFLYSKQIDIIQEMNGFCTINRFGALSRKPAPIQVNWYNHTSTTGLPYIDYVMSDRVSIHDSDLPCYVENVYRDKNFNAAVYFDPDKFGGIDIQPPCERNGYITFGYFGASHKLTQQGIEAWARVLHAVQGSRLILKSATYDHALYRDLFIGYFKKNGIDSDRVTLDGWTNQPATLQRYNDVDITLDNIPVSGGSTIFESLMQGVPAITCMGGRWAARSGASVLYTLGHEELVANSVDKYVDIAVNVARSVDKIKRYRICLPEEMQSSSLTSIKTFYNNFERAYTEMYSKFNQIVEAS